MAAEVSPPSGPSNPTQSTDSVASLGQWLGGCSELKQWKAQGLSCLKLAPDDWIPVSGRESGVADEIGCWADNRLVVLLAQRRSRLVGEIGEPRR